MTEKEKEIYLQGAKDFAQIVEKDILSRSYSMPKNPQLHYVYTTAITDAIQNSLTTIDIKNFSY